MSKQSRNPRVEHVGKNRVERDAYGDLLAKQQGVDPTSAEYESTSTGSPVKNLTQTTTTPDVDLKPYKPQPPRVAWSTIIISAVLGLLQVLLLLFGGTLNRQVGVLEEKVSDTRTTQAQIMNRIDSLDNAIRDLTGRIGTLSGQLDARRNNF